MSFQRLASLRQAVAQSVPSLGGRLARRRLATQTTSAAAAANEKTITLLDKHALRLTLAVPHQKIFAHAPVQQVNIATTEGEMGFLADHAPAVHELRPGLFEVIDLKGVSQKYFVPGGFVVMMAESLLDVTAIEAVKIEDLDENAVNNLLSEAKTKAAALPEGKEKAFAQVDVDVYESMQYALKQL